MGKRLKTGTTGRAMRLGLLVAVVVGATATHGSAGGTRAGGPRVRTATCAEAAIARVAMPTGSAIDGVRVILAPGSSPSGAADVAVHAGAFDRVVHVRGDSRALQFSPPLVADAGALAVTIDPVWDAATTACVERIELLHGGAIVNTVHP